MSMRVGFGMGLLLSTVAIPYAALAGQWTSVERSVPAVRVDLAEAKPRVGNWPDIAQAAPAFRGRTNLAPTPAPHTPPAAPPPGPAAGAIGTESWRAKGS